MQSFKKEHLSESIRNKAGEFFARNSNLTSLITVTRVEISDHLKTGVIYLSVMPEGKETEALHFAKRYLGEMREYLDKQIRTGRLPFFSIEIDKGEKLRNKIDEVL